MLWVDMGGHMSWHGGHRSLLMGMGSNSKESVGL